MQNFILHPERLVHAVQMGQMIKQTFKGQPGSNDSEYLIANTLASFFYLDSHNTASIQC